MPCVRLDRIQPTCRRRARAWRVVGAAAILLGLTTGVAYGGAGGVGAPPPPKVSDVVCVRKCVGLHAAVVSSTVQASGSNLKQATKMVFARKNGGRVVATTSARTASHVSAVVPSGSITGKPIVKDNYGGRAVSPKVLEIHPRRELGPSGGSIDLALAQATPQRAFFDGGGPVRFRYMIRSQNAKNNLRIDVVSQANGSAVKSFFVNNVPPNSQRSLGWYGRADSGKFAAKGGYKFRVSTQGGAAVPSHDPNGDVSFGFYFYEFPVRGQHSYGDGFGAPRAGHTHQGQDIPASCGTKLVAARGGRVQYRSYQSAAGNYIVIDGKATGIDFAYMHLAHPALVAAGKTVHTGQKIGYVGQTGDAVGCHLHFEMWTAPGWYQGGHPFDAKPYLKRWDRYS